MAMFSFSSNGASDTGGEILTVNLPALAIRAGADNGSIMLKLVNSTTESDFGTGTGTKEQMYSDAIGIVKGLDEIFKPGGVVTATVADNFRLFGGNDYASLGTLEFGVTMNAMDATDGMQVQLGDLITVAEMADESSSLAFSGNFSFAKALWLHDIDHRRSRLLDDCSAGPAADANLLKTDDDDVVENESKSVNVYMLHEGMDPRGQHS